MEFHEFKQKVKNIPFFGPVIKNAYQKTKQEIKFILHSKRKDRKFIGEE